MHPLREPFDTELPCFFASEQRIGDRAFAADDPAPWRELGVSEHVLFDWWRSGAVYFAKAAERETFTKTPGELVKVTPPRPSRKRN